LTVTEAKSESSNKNLILVVDDNPAARSHLREVLVPMYNVEEAVDGIQGFELAKKLIPDLVISDINIPGMAGTQLSKTLKKHSETYLIPLILLYYQNEEKLIVKGFESGADDCIARPFNVNIFKTRIKNLVDNQKQLLDKIRLWGMPQPAQQDVNYEDAKFAEQLHGIIEENLSNPLFKIEEICDKLFVSRSTMYRKIRFLTGESPQLFVRSYRLKRAAQLLENNQGTVTQVCFSVGFTSTAYFARRFKEKFHLSPRAFLKACAKSL
jgi:DNA-binding response OmpR family regulator